MYQQARPARATAKIGTRLSVSMESSFFMERPFGTEGRFLATAGDTQRSGHAESWTASVIDGIDLTTVFGRPGLDGIGRERVFRRFRQSVAVLSSSEPGRGGRMTDRGNRTTSRGNFFSARTLDGGGRRMS